MSAPVIATAAEVRNMLPLLHAFFVIIEETGMATMMLLHRTAGQTLLLYTSQYHKHTCAVTLHCCDPPHRKHLKSAILSRFACCLLPLQCVAGATPSLNPLDVLHIFTLPPVLCRPAVGNEDITANSSLVRRHAVPLVCGAQPHIWQCYMTACGIVVSAMSSQCTG